MRGCGPGCRSSRVVPSFPGRLGTHDTHKYPVRTGRARPRYRLSRGWPWPQAQPSTSILQWQHTPAGRPSAPPPPPPALARWLIRATTTPRENRPPGERASSSKRLRNPFPRHSLLDTPRPLLRPPPRRCISIRQDWLYPPAPACLLACPLLRWPPPRLVCLEPALPCLILKLYLPLALTHTHTRPHKHPHPHHTNAPALLASARLALIVRIVSGFLGILRLPFYLTLRVAGVPVSADTTRRHF